MINLVIEALYASVFVHSFVTYLRHRDPVRRDLTLVFVPLTSLLVLEVVRKLTGARDLPLALAYVAVALLLAQPYLTLRLVRTLRPVQPWVSRTAFGVFVVTTAPFLIVGEEQVAVLTLAAVLGFFLVQGAAALLLAGEARRRTGAPRARLALAAAATAVLGLCLLMAGAGSAAGQDGHIVQVTAEVLAVLSGVSYVVAFLPPQWLRRVWSGGAAYQVHRQVADGAADEAPQEVWRRYAAAVREASGAAAAVVLLPAGGDRVAGVAGDGDTPELSTTVADLDRLLARPQPVVVPGAGKPPPPGTTPTPRTAGTKPPRGTAATNAGATIMPGSGESPLLEYARRLSARTLVVVPVRAPGPGRGALVLLSRRYPMFVEDDARLLGELGTQAAILAERGAAAESIRVNNALLEQRIQERTTELQQAQAALAAQNATLEQSNERLQRFAYVASHDLQEPLRKIISFSGLLMERQAPGADPDTAMYVDRIVGSAARMKRLIEDLLRFSRIGGAVEEGPVDCADVVRSVLDSLAVALSESGGTVTHDPLPVVRANRTLLEMLFQNLIGNAVKYRAAAPPRIHIAAAPLDGRWRLTVSDNGIGFDMVYAERIFQVFQRLHPRGQYDGTGIGLAICQRIVEAGGGRIGVDSVPGAGSTFWFTLPPAQPQALQEETDALAHTG